MYAGSSFPLARLVFRGHSSGAMTTTELPIYMTLPTVVRRALTRMESSPLTATANGTTGAIRLVRWLHDGPDRALA